MGIFLFDKPGAGLKKGARNLEWLEAKEFGKPVAIETRRMVHEAYD